MLLSLVIFMITSAMAIRDLSKEAKMEGAQVVVVHEVTTDAVEEPQNLKSARNQGTKIARKDADIEGTPCATCSPTTIPIGQFCREKGYEWCSSPPMF